MIRVFFVLAIPAAFLIYGVALEAPLQLDDGAVLENARHLSWTTRPLGFATFWLTNQIAIMFSAVFPWQLSLYHRVANIAIHVFAATALFWLVRTLAGKTSIAATAGTLFLVHPIQTQAVTYVSQRFESQAMLFMLLSAGAYAAFRKSGRMAWFAFAVASGGAAVLTKETAIVLPLWLLLIELCFFDRSIFRSKLMYAVPVAGLFLIPAWRAFSSSAQTLTWIPWWRYFISQGPVLAKYLDLSVWPREQFLYYDAQPVETFTAVVLLQWILVLAVAGLGIFLLRRQTLAAFGILSFFVLLLPVTLLPLPDMIFEHRIYPAFAGVAVTAAAVSQIGKRKSVAAIIAAVALLLGVKTVLRNSEWNDDLAFIERHRMKFPDSPGILSRLGSYYYMRGHVNRGIEAMELARQYQERFNAYYRRTEQLNIAGNLVMMYVVTGQPEAALAEAKRAISIKPDDPYAIRALAAAQMALRDYEAARATWERFVQLQPKDPDALSGLHRTLVRLGDDTAAGRVASQLDRLETEAGKAPRPWFRIGLEYRTHAIFGLTIAVLIAVFLGVRTIWQALKSEIPRPVNETRWP